MSEKINISEETVAAMNEHIQSANASFKEIDRRFGIFVDKFTRLQEEVDSLKKIGMAVEESLEDAQQIKESSALLKTSMDILKKTFDRLENALQRIDNLENTINELGYNEPQIDERQKDLKQFKKKFFDLGE